MPFPSCMAACVVIWAPKTVSAALWPGLLTLRSHLQAENLVVEILNAKFKLLLEHLKHFMLCAHGDLKISVELCRFTDSLTVFLHVV